MKPKVELITASSLKGAVMAARMCYDSFINGDSHNFCGEWQLGPKDKIRLEKCVKSKHNSILEHISYTFRIEGISRACSHQIVRHRVGMSPSQRSQRYVKEKTPEYITPQSIIDKMGAEYFSTRMELIWDWYNEMLATGVPAEDARFILTNATETKFVYTMNAASLRHLLELRLAKGAQWEIQDMCKEIYNVIPKEHKFLYQDLVDGVV